jgi:hypothetical protein
MPSHQGRQRATHTPATPQFGAIRSGCIQTASPLPKKSPAQGKGEPSRDCRRLRLLRGRSHDERNGNSYSPEIRERAVRMVWGTGAMPPNGKRSHGLHRRLAAQGRRCACGCGGLNAMRGFGLGVRGRASVDQEAGAGEPRAEAGQRDPAQGVCLFCPMRSSTAGSGPPSSTITARRMRSSRSARCCRSPRPPTRPCRQAAHSSQQSARAKRDEALKVEVRRVFEENFRVYGRGDSCSAKASGGCAR